MIDDWLAISNWNSQGNSQTIHVLCFHITILSPYGLRSGLTLSSALAFVDPCGARDLAAPGVAPRFLEDMATNWFKLDVSLPRSREQAEGVTPNDPGFEPCRFRKQYHQTKMRPKRGTQAIDAAGGKSRIII